RPDAIYGPKDVVPGTLTPNGIPTIKFEYKPLIDTAFTQATPPPVTVTPSQATTHHKDTSRASAATTTDTIDTVTYIDGFERVIQTAKEDEVTDGTNAGVAGFTISGRVTFDPMGRLQEQGQPIFLPALGASIADVPMQRQTTFHYDSLSRSLGFDTPDGVSTTIDYGIEVKNGRQLFKKTTTDPKKLPSDLHSRVETQWRDGRQRILYVDQFNTFPPATTQTQLTTQYEYDRFDQLLTVTDANTNVTRAAYDSVGQMIKLVSLDAGQTEYLFDLAGQLGARETANLRAANKLIKYVYDKGRLTKIDHPDSADVTYVYGTTTAFGRNGRIQSVTDE